MMCFPRPLARRIFVVILGGILCSSGTLGSEVSAETDVLAEELIRRAFFNFYAQDYIQTIQLTTYPRSGRGMSRTIQVIRKESKKGAKVLLRFTDPPFMRGASVLIIEGDNYVDDLYVYFPEIRRTRHLASSQRGESFFGTDLSYEDIQPKKVEDYEVKSLGACSADKEPGTLVEMTPKPILRSVYGRLITCVEEGRGQILWTNFYKGGDRIKRLEVDQSSFKEIESRIVPFRMTMRDLERGSFTVIETATFDLAPDLPEKLFSARNLEVGNSRRDRAAAEEREGKALDGGESLATE